MQGLSCFLLCLIRLGPASDLETKKLNRGWLRTVKDQCEFADARLPRNAEPDSGAITYQFWLPYPQLRPLSLQRWPSQ
jgi:hypothetical protein